MVTLNNNFQGRKKLSAFLENNLSINVPNLRPPRRKNKKRLRKRSVERFKEKVEDVVKKSLKREYNHLFHNKQSREIYVKQLGKVLIHSGGKNIGQHQWSTFKFFKASFFWDELNVYSVNIITKKEEENFLNHHGDLSWNNFIVGRKQRSNIQNYLERKITFDRLIWYL